MAIKNRNILYMDFSKKSFEQYSGIGQYDKWLKLQHFFRTMRFYYNQYQEALNKSHKAYAKECLVYMCAYNDAAKMLDLYSFNTWKLFDRLIFKLRKEVIIL